MNHMTDKEIGRARIEEIDRIRATGGKTELEIWWRSVANNRAYRKQETRGIKHYMKVVDMTTGEEKHYKSMKQACNDNGLGYATIKSKFNREWLEELEIDNFIITKIDKDLVNKNLLQNSNRVKRGSNWSEKDKCFLVQMRPEKTWRQIADKLRRTLPSCEAKYRRLEKEDKLDYYRNLKID